ncbi:protein adenylyltransferase SelO family protein [Sedimenticola hydrogenitrophicus]|uniref:protein adenylyltransferase SelO family protein n=1 Tax=Sedimenticola hydrogenitrophicus TaxID=2967975 RepID=UPI0021A8B9F3|nr:protein adenylyltransferase SelO family protein [Sedimenticola hydrogenitrophicus]
MVGYWNVNPAEQWYVDGRPNPENLNFDNSYVRLPGHFYQRIDPSPLEGAHLISINPDVARLLDLDLELLNPDELARYFGGHVTLPGTESIAMKYTGHQFGVYNPDLGDHHCSLDRALCRADRTGGRHAAAKSGPDAGREPKVYPA